MGASDVNLAELIGSRICHDLISPIGAITNGLELLEMVGAVQGPEMELISGSVGSADQNNDILIPLRPTFFSHPGIAAWLESEVFPLKDMNYLKAKGLI